MCLVGDALRDGQRTASHTFAWCGPRPELFEHTFHDCAYNGEGQEDDNYDAHAGTELPQGLAEHIPGKRAFESFDEGFHMFALVDCFRCQHN